jgi:hypothetical protein
MLRSGLARWDHPSDDSHMGVIMLVALLGGLLFGAYLFWRMSQPSATVGVQVIGVTTEARPPNRALSGATPIQNVAQPAAPAAEAQPTSAPPAAPTAAPATDKAHIAHTDGTGVVLRASPRDADRTPRGFMDGTDVTVLERQGAEWVRVRGPNGQEGWIPTRYLEAG